MRKKYSLPSALLLALIIPLIWQTNSHISQQEMNDRYQELRFRYKRIQGHPEKYAEIEREKRTPSDRTKPDYGPNDVLEEYEKSIQRAAKARTSSNYTFVERGPGNIAGRTRGVAIDPTDPNELTWFASSASGGVWKTIDGGQQWVLKSNGLPNLGSSSIVIAPSNPDIMYLGTGEFFTDDVDGAGLFKSTDHGESWQQVLSPATFPEVQNIGRIVVDPNDANHVLVATQSSVWGDFASAIYKSIDGGQNWLKVFYSERDRVDQIIYAPSNFNIQYAALFGKGVIKSTDAGLTWEESSAGMNPNGRIELAISSIDENYLWASVNGAVSGSNSDLYLSKNGGQVWNILAELEGTLDFLDGQGWYDNTILAHPFDKNTVYVGGVDLWKFSTTDSVTAGSYFEYDPGQTDQFMELINFGGDYFEGLMDIPGADSMNSIEFRFGQGTQLAYQFIVPRSMGSGVPPEDYAYRGYVEVPFQVWDVTKNQQLMVSFRDQQRNDVWDLIGENTTGADPTEHSRDYIFAHLIPYDTIPDSLIAMNGGHEYRQAAFFWPVLAQGASFNPDNLPISTLLVDKKSNERIFRSSFNISDSRDQYEGNNANRQDLERHEDGIHPDHHNLLITNLDSTDRSFRLLVANDGGLYRSKLSSDPGVANNDFEYVSFGYNTTQFYSADKMPGQDRYIGGMQDNGTWVTAEGETSSASSNFDFVFYGDGFETLWNNRDEDLILASVYNNLFVKSSDGGSNWRIADNGITEDDGPFLTRLVNSRSSPDKVYAVGSRGVYSSEDFGDNWKMNTVNASGWTFGSTSNIEVSYANSNIVWAGSRMDNFGNLVVSTNGGESWANTSVPAGTTLGSISGIGTHPAKDSTGFALFSFKGRAKVLRTNDLGKTWTDISGFDGGPSRGFPDVAVSCIFVFPANPNRIWVGSEIGIIESEDNGASWHLITQMPPVKISDVKSQDDQLIIATFGRGIWTITSPDLETEIVFAPVVNRAFIAPDGKMQLEVVFTDVFDSTQIILNGSTILTVGQNEKGIENRKLTNPRVDGFFNLKTVAFLNGRSYESQAVNTLLFDTKEPADGYVQTFNNALDELIGNGFDIQKTAGFDDAAIHSSHNYPAATDLIYVLKTPIIISDQAAWMKYKDVAIIETGKAGISFPDPEFYDYVVVEGSTDGTNWQPLAPGYDASYDPNWLATYESNEAGDQSLLKEHEIDLLNTFNPGDTILIRFRLFSDPGLQAWGWAIDDLAIQKELEMPLGNQLADDVGIFPNPLTTVSELIYPENLTGILTIADLNGKVVLTKKLSSGPGSIRLDRNRFTNGLYVVRIQASTGESFVSKLIVN
ncbi:MAG: T9SS type A sorting domain-containing protein [Cyclobacteriaceae bacterium]